MEPIHATAPVSDALTTLPIPPRFARLLPCFGFSPRIAASHPRFLSAIQYFCLASTAHLCRIFPFLRLPSLDLAPRGVFESHLNDANSGDTFALLAALPAAPSAMFVRHSVIYNPQTGQLTCPLFALTILVMVHGQSQFAGFFRPDHDPPVRMPNHWILTFVY
jgi:hypothetical protein